MRKFNTPAELKAHKIAVKQRNRARQKLRRSEPGYRKPVGIKTRGAGAEMPAEVPGETIYGRRNRLLRWLGFKTYQHYLNSPLWRGIRAAVFKRDGARCRKCGNVAVHAHHKSYSLEVLEGKDMNAIVALCDLCHWNTEFHANGNKKY